MCYAFHHSALTSFLSVSQPSLFHAVLSSLGPCAISRTLLIGAHLVWVRNAMGSTYWKGATPLHHLLPFLLQYLQFITLMYGILDQAICLMPNQFQLGIMVNHFVLKSRILLVIFAHLQNKNVCLSIKALKFLLLVLI